MNKTWQVVERVGLDYAHSTVYFDLVRTVKLPDVDVVGLIAASYADTITIAKLCIVYRL